MSLYVNNTQVLTGEINMPLNGLWYADLRINGTNTFSPGQSVQIKQQNDNFLTGSIAADRIGELLNVVYVRILGGNGGMAKPATAKAFQNGTVQDVLKSLMNDSGEKLSNTIDASVLSTQLANWTIFGDTVEYQINALATFLQMNWRFLSDGTFWIGTESYPNSNKFAYTVLDHDLINGYVNMGVDALTMLPGYNVDGYQAGKVVHEIMETKLRTKVYQPIGIGDRSITTAIGAIVNSKVAPINFFTQYSASVDSQSSDMSKVDLTPDDTRLPGMKNIPFYSNLAGTMVQFTGGKVFLGWFSGNPTKPYAIMQANSGETMKKMIITVGGLKITLDDGGNSITIDATGDTVNINAKDVKVSVSDAMDVS